MENFFMFQQWLGDDLRQPFQIDEMKINNNIEFK